MLTGKHRTFIPVTTDHNARHPCLMLDGGTACAIHPGDTPGCFPVKIDKQVHAFTGGTGLPFGVGHRLLSEAGGGGYGVVLVGKPHEDNTAGGSG